MQKIISKIKYRAFVWKKIGRFTWKATGVNSILIDLVLDSSNLFLAAPPMLLFFFGKPIKRDTLTLVSLPSAPNGRNEPKRTVTNYPPIFQRCYSSVETKKSSPLEQ